MAKNVGKDFEEEEKMLFILYILNILVMKIRTIVICPGWAEAKVFLSDLFEDVMEQLAG